MVHVRFTRHSLYITETAYKPDSFANRQSNPEADGLERDLEAGWNIHLRSQATVLQVPSEHKYSPVSQGSMMLMVRVTLAFKLEME